MNYIGIDLGGTNIKGALVSAKGEILKEHSIPTRVDLCLLYTSDAADE